MELVSLRCNRDFTSASSYGLGWYKYAIATQWYQFHTTDAWWFSLNIWKIWCNLRSKLFFSQVVCYINFFTLALMLFFALWSKSSVGQLHWWVYLSGIRNRKWKVLIQILLGCQMLKTHWFYRLNANPAFLEYLYLKCMYVLCVSVWNSVDHVLFYIHMFPSESGYVFEAHLSEPKPTDVTPY